MKICSKILVSDWVSCQRGVCKPKESVLELYKNGDSVYINIFYSSSNASRRFKISANIERLFTGHVKEGNLTLRLKNPPKDVMIQQAEPSDLLRLIGIWMLSDPARNCPIGFLIANMLQAKNGSQRRLCITRREDYPFSQGFSTFLHEISAKNLRLRQFDARLLKLFNLRSLDLSANYVEKVPQGIQDLNLVQLCLSNNHITNWPCITESSPLTKTLELIDLSHNKLVWLPDDFWLLANLKSVNLSNNRLRGVPAAYLHKLQRLCKVILNDNQLDSLPLVLTAHRLTQLSVYNNSFLPHGMTVKSSGVAPTLLNCASSNLLRSNWYPCLENCLPWNLRVRLAVLRICLRCRLKCGVEPYRVLVPYNSWLNMSCDRENPPSILTYLCSEKCLAIFRSNTWKYTLD
ncbi:unnamed protein product [Heterobilharzia americana]|nr:unnamed protein product [Heterobilharzia americana]